MNVNQLNRGIAIGFLVILYKNRTELRNTAEITSILQFINYFKKSVNNIQLVINC